MRGERWAVQSSVCVCVKLCVFLFFIWSLWLLWGLTGLDDNGWKLYQGITYELISIMINVTLLFLLSLKTDVLLLSEGFGFKLFMSREWHLINSSTFYKSELEILCYTFLLFLLYALALYQYLWLFVILILMEMPSFIFCNAQLVPHISHSTHSFFFTAEVRLWHFTAENMKTCVAQQLAGCCHWQ